MQCFAVNTRCMEFLFAPVEPCGYSSIHVCMSTLNDKATPIVCPSARDHAAKQTMLDAACAIAGARAVSFDDQWKVRWCCPAFAAEYGASVDSLIGVDVESLLGVEPASQHRMLCRPASERGIRAKYVGFFGGRRSVIAAFPLDAQEFGYTGVLCVFSPAIQAEDGRGLPVASFPNLGRALGRLSKAELCVAYFFACGLIIPRIGERLCRSEHTVNDHIKAIHRKLGVSRQAELATFLAHTGIAAFTEAEWCEVTGVSIPNPSTTIESSGVSLGEKRGGFTLPVADSLAQSMPFRFPGVPCGHESCNGQAV